MLPIVVQERSLLSENGLFGLGAVLVLAVGGLLAHYVTAERVGEAQRSSRMGDLSSYDQAIIWMSITGIMLGVGGGAAMWFLFAPREGDPGAVERD